MSPRTALKNDGASLFFALTHPETRISKLLISFGGSRMCNVLNGHQVPSGLLHGFTWELGQQNIVSFLDCDSMARKLVIRREPG